MQKKDIKRLVIKQLKTKFPYWWHLTKKQKKTSAEEALNDVKASCEPKQVMPVPFHELTNMPALPGGIIPLAEMGKFIETRVCNLLPFVSRCYQRNLDDQELRLIDRLLDNRMLNDLLASPIYAPATRQVSPAQLIGTDRTKDLYA